MKACPTCGRLPLGSRGPIPADMTPRAVVMREIDHVAHAWGLELADLLGPSRIKAIAFARFHAFAVVRGMGRFSLPKIGRLFGGRDHTTILSGIRRYETLTASGEMDAYRASIGLPPLQSDQEREAA